METAVAAAFLSAGRLYNWSAAPAVCVGCDPEKSTRPGTVAPTSFWAALGSFALGPAGFSGAAICAASAFSLARDAEPAGAGVGWRVPYACATWKGIVGGMEVVELMGRETIGREEGVCTSFSIVGTTTRRTVE